MRLKPWYDAYGGPYKDEYRSWTGVLLLARCLLALFAALENDQVAILSVLAWVCLCMRHVNSFFLSGVQDQDTQRVRNDVLGVPSASGVVLLSERRSKH